MFCFMTKHTLLGLGCVFLPWTHASGRFGTFCVPKCCTIRNLPRKSESCDKIRRFLPWVLISWQVLAAWCPLQAWCLDGEARGSVACAGSADRDRGGRSRSRTVGSRAASSWSPRIVTARAPMASISRALPTARSCSSPTKRADSSRLMVY